MTELLRRFVSLVLQMDAAAVVVVVRERALICFIANKMLGWIPSVLNVDDWKRSRRTLTFVAKQGAG